ncbi:MerR family transcriptional regulator [Streptomyces sp. NPDC102467]|uniref:MerR family transcriptional regulator n=1 Tax=Streptomyces sp. NPDC102467 TaxID=3366179 RepID=UPI003815CC24
MGLLTIGAFARASRLSPKALRLYDELGLLPPARVDPATGYRMYAPEQLEQARLVAWLRRLGMPLARIRQVCAMPSDAASQEVRAFWAEVEADTAARRDLAAFLVDHLSLSSSPFSSSSLHRKDSAMTSNVVSLGLRYAALSDRGLVRESNQDSVYAGPHLLAVADGFGPTGAPASAAAVDALTHLDTADISAGDLIGALEDAVERAGRAVAGTGDATRAPAGADAEAEADGEADADAGAEAEAAGTTLTAILRAGSGSRLALVHIGDTSVRLLRDGDLFQITHDHTMVQSMVDEGRLTPEEAASHPQRSLLVRALGRPADATPDLRLHDARAGDRYLLCSDGLSSVVPADEIHRVLAGTAAEPDRAARELVALANESGGPDNISCVVADVVELGRP